MLRHYDIETQLIPFGTASEAAPVLPWSAASECRTFSISIRQFPEGVWGVAASNIPGLNIEGDTQEEARDEAVKWAYELLVDNHIISPGTHITLVFY